MAAGVWMQQMWGAKGRSALCMLPCMQILSSVQLPPPMLHAVPLCAMQVLSDAAVLKRQAKEIEELRRMLTGTGCGGASIPLSLGEWLGRVLLEREQCRAMRREWSILLQMQPPCYPLSVFYHSRNEHIEEEINRLRAELLRKDQAS